MNFMLMISRVEYCPEPLYNYLVRQNSLTQSPRTGKGSPARAAVQERLRAMFFDAYDAYAQFLVGHLSSRDLTRRIRSIAARNVSHLQRLKIASECARLRRMMYG